MWLVGGVSSCLWGEQGLVPLGKDQAPHLPSYAHCPLQAVSAYLPCVRGLRGAQTHCGRGHWGNVGGSGRAACVLDSVVLAGCCLPIAGWGQVGLAHTQSLHACGAVTLLLLVVLRSKGHMQVRHLLVPGYACGPS